MNIGIVLAGGVGNRYGSSIPKQYNDLCGNKVIYYSIMALKNCESIDKVLVACDRLYQTDISKQYNVDVCDGGSTRNITIQNSLDYIKKNFNNVDKLIFIDSARPLCRHEHITDVINALDNYDSVITGQKITDSLGSCNNRNLNREDYYLVQTPEAFTFNMFNQYFDVNSTCTALYQQMPDDSSLYVYFGIKNNMKITYPGDISYIENNFSEVLEKGK